MMKSMTGFGRGEFQGEGMHVEVEVKSFNHRYCDVFLHLPRRLNSLEGQIRNLVKQRVSRGRIEIAVQSDLASLADQTLELDMNVARDLHSALRALQENLGLPGEIRLETMANFKEIFSRKEVEMDAEKEWAGIQAALEGALNGLESMRCEEGVVLRRDFGQRLKNVEEIVGAIEEKAPLVLQACRERLAQRVKELSGGIAVDEGRLAQEVAYLAERSDISEELVRLRSHIHQFREMLDRPEPMGRKLEFILQEINREANTIGSKANDAGMAQMTVDIKGDLEKMREQVQNVE